MYLHAEILVHELVSRRARTRELLSAIRRVVLERLSRFGLLGLPGQIGAQLGLLHLVDDLDVDGLDQLGGHRAATVFDRVRSLIAD